MSRKNLQIQQLNNKMVSFASVQQQAVPASGWVRTIRSALGMSMQQLGRKLSISKQSVQDIEKREQEGSITLRSLRETARALDMQLVYGFVPNGGSLDALIEQKARELATEIVLRSSHTMLLEGQENSEQRIRKAIEERTVLLKNEMPKILWD
ncbi:MAG: mobile mystery protein A [Bacteroidia bacterium]|nr:mobile mystery protein A [Bacteroidia bacterium]